MHEKELVPVPVASPPVYHRVPVPVPVQEPGQAQEIACFWLFVIGNVGGYCFLHPFKKCQVEIIPKVRITGCCWIPLGILGRFFGTPRISEAKRVFRWLFCVCAFFGGLD